MKGAFYMKEFVNRIIDKFEEKFNFIIDTLALVGGLFCFLLAIYAFIVGILGYPDLLNILDVVIISGLLGFFGIIVLFALRITRHLTKR